MTLFPKFPFYLASPYYEENILKYMDPKILRSKIDIENNDGLSKLPIGDTIDNKEIQSIRDKCMLELESYGVSIDQPPNDSIRHELDYRFTVSLYKNLQNYLEPSMASDTEMWMFFNLRVFPDLVIYRWRKKSGQNYSINPEHFFKLTRNYCGTLWWRAHFFRDELNPNDQWWLLRQLSEDNLVSITERTNLRGYSKLPLVLGKKMIEINKLETPYKFKEILFRRMMVILLARVSCLNLHLLETMQGEVEELVDGAYGLAYEELNPQKGETIKKQSRTIHNVVDPESVIAWLVTQPNTNGTLYLENVAKQYMDILNSTPKKLELSIPLTERSVFSCHSPEELTSFWDNFKTAPNYQTVNSSTSGMFAAGMSCLMRYLQHISKTTPIADIAGKPDVIHLIKSFELKYVDKRNSGGALWVIGGRELTAVMIKLRNSGFRFLLKEGGGKSSDYKDAWWHR
ncbi:MAG: DUF6339 family protein [Sphaerochaeta sp.]|nr:DUF6339 family protein [Sphaerochaeta sp.]